jgi:hypothetical protein
MNCSSLIPALAGGLLAVVWLPGVEQHRSVAPSQVTLTPAIVRIYEPNGRLAPSPARAPYGWSSTERQVGQNSEDFRKLTSQEIEACALVLEGMVRRSRDGALGSRTYLNTRLQALREHVDYARSELMKLPSNQSDDNFIPAHAHFYRTMRSLEQAFAQAATELNGDI